MMLFLNKDIITEGIRGALSMTIPQIVKAPVSSSANSDTRHFISDTFRFIRKIPARNYARLNEYSPIGWL